MKQTTTNRMGFASPGNSIRNNAMRLFMILALSGSSFTYAQRVENSDIKPVENQTSNGYRNPSAGTTRGNPTSLSFAPTINALIMLDMGWDKAILSWNTTATFDSIIFRFAPTGSMITRTVGI